MHQRCFQDRFVADFHLVVLSLGLFLQHLFKARAIQPNDNGDHFLFDSGACSNTENPEFAVALRPGAHNPNRVVVFEHV